MFLANLPSTPCNAKNKDYLFWTSSGPTLLHIECACVGDSSVVR